MLVKKSILNGLCLLRLETVYSELLKESKVIIFINFLNILYLGFLGNWMDVAVTVHHIESMIRMTEAQAKMHFRSQVNDEDVNAAIRISLECFIQTLKASVTKQMRKVSFLKFILMNLIACRLF